jgi:hypothetical protein
VTGLAELAAIVADHEARICRLENLLAAASPQVPDPADAPELAEPGQVIPMPGTQPCRAVTPTGEACKRHARYDYTRGEYTSDYCFSHRGHDDEGGAS